MQREQRTGSTRRSFLTYAGTATAVAVGAGCVGDGDDGGDGSDETRDGNGDSGSQPIESDVTITQRSLPLSLDPIRQNDTPTWNVLDQVYEPLLGRDAETGEPVERLATGWERTGDRRVELEVRDGVTFHGGAELTAEDVARSIERTNDPDVSVQAGVIGAIDEARAVDGRVVITLERVEPSIFRTLTAYGRVQQHSWVRARTDDELATETNGTGPYELADGTDGEEVVLARFEDYWGAEPAVEEVTFDAADEEARVDRLLAGESDLVTDVAPADVDAIEAESGVDAEFVPSTRAIFVALSTDDEPFDSRAFRQATNYAVDVESVVDAVLEGFGDPIGQPSLPMQFGYAPDVDPYPYDPARAEELVEESGYAGAEVTIETPTGRYRGDADVAEAVAEQLDELETVDADVERRDTASLFDEISSDDASDSPASFLVGWVNQTYDALDTLEPWFASGSFQYFRNDEIRESISEANAETDDAVREELLRDVNRRLRDFAPWIFLYQEYAIYGVSEALEWDARADRSVLVREIEYT